MEERLHTGREHGNHFWCWEHALPIVTVGTRSGRLGEANPMSHVDACVDLLNEGSWDPAVANTTAYLTGSVFTVAKVKQSPVQNVIIS